MTSPTEGWQWSPIEGWRPRLAWSGRLVEGGATPTLRISVETSEDGVDWTNPATSTPGVAPSPPNDSPAR